MLFTNARSVVASQPVKRDGKQPPSIAMFSMPMTRAVLKPAVVVPPPVNKVKWGPAVWYLLHTSAAKINPDHFSTTGKELLTHIITICNNLPCPKCASHASTYMAQVNRNNIKTKDDLIRLLFVFHNDVNKRLGYPEFAYSEVNDKYAAANLVNVFNNFIHHFKDHHRLTHMIADDMYRARLCRQITDWFTRNLDHFDK